MAIAPEASAAPKASTAPETSAAIDERKVEAAVGKVFGELGVSVTGPLIVLGDKLGLWAALAETGPVTPAGLAASTATVERYVREWLRGVAVAGYVDYSPADGTFTLPGEMALVLASDDSPASLIGVFPGFTALWADLDRVAGFFRTGGGMGWADHHPVLNDAQARFTRPMYRAALVDGWIAALDGVTARLRSGGQVADVGCGQGISTILMAEAFPASQFVGFDHGDVLIAAARKAAVAAASPTGPASRSPTPRHSRWPPEATTSSRSPTRCTTPATRWPPRRTPARRWPPTGRSWSLSRWPPIVSKTTSPTRTPASVTPSPPWSARRHRWPSPARPH